MRMESQRCSPPTSGFRWTGGTNRTASTPLTAAMAAPRANACEKSLATGLVAPNDRCHPFTRTKTADEILPHP